MGSARAILVTGATGYVGGRLIRLRAEMKVPGRAWLEFESRPESSGETLLLQTAFFEPKGLFGLLYRYVLYPIHSLIFNGLIGQIARQAASTERPAPRP